MFLYYIKNFINLLFYKCEEFENDDIFQEGELVFDEYYKKLNKKSILDDSLSYSSLYSISIEN